MKIVTNHKLIAKNKKIGTYLTIGSLVVLGGGLVASFNQELLTWSFVALFFGFIISQLGIYYGSRWGRSPRMDEKLAAGLKGMGDQYTLYNYSTDVSHLLAGPAGIWVLLPYYQAGKITYDEKRGKWKQKGGNLYMKIFAQESLGRPDLDAKTAMAGAQKFLAQYSSTIELPEPKAALIFTNEKAVVECDNAPLATLAGNDMKDFFRRIAKETPAPLESMRALQKMLPSEKDYEEEKKK